METIALIAVVALGLNGIAGWYFVARVVTAGQQQATLAAPGYAPRAARLRTPLPFPADDATDDGNG